MLEPHGQELANWRNWSYTSSWPNQFIKVTKGLQQMPDHIFVHVSAGKIKFQRYLRGRRLFFFKTRSSQILKFLISITGYFDGYAY